MSTPERDRHPVLQTVGLSAERGGRTIVQEIDLAVSAGTTLAITGPSGAGKSTLLAILGLLSAPRSGRILINGTEVTSASVRQRSRLYRDTIGFVFQDFAIVEDWTVERNVRVGTRPLRLAPELERRRVSDALATVGLGGRDKQLADQLSGGEKQRVALARLLAKKPSLVLADEPTGSLDSGNRDVVLRSFTQLAAHGSAVIVVTHDPGVARWADHQVHLESGLLGSAVVA